MLFATVEYQGKTFVGVVDKAGEKVTPVSVGDINDLFRGARGESKGPAIALSAVKLKAPVPLPLRNIMCVGKNYHEHAKEFSASGFDSSVGTDADANGGESGYVGYEMWVRELETQLGGIVGASGCFYGIRRHVHDTNFPEQLSRDFASVLIARFRGYRAVSVRDALCYVPRTKALDAELERKVRTMARGLETLWYMRALLNPVRFRWFAFKLFSHKLCRWLVSLSLPGGIIGLAMLGLSQTAFMPVLVAFAGGVGLGIAGLRWSTAGQQPPRVLALAGFALAANLAGVRAWYRALRGQSTPVWEPTRRAA